MEKKKRREKVLATSTMNGKGRRGASAGPAFRLGFIKSSHTCQKRAGQHRLIRLIGTDGPGRRAGQNRHAADDLFVAMIRGFPLFLSLSPFSPLPDRPQSAWHSLRSFQEIPFFPMGNKDGIPPSGTFLTRSQVFFVRAVAMPYPKRKRPFPWPGAPHEEESLLQRLSFFSWESTDGLPLP
jgi:hypothetical protein